MADPRDAGRDAGRGAAPLPRETGGFRLLRTLGRGGMGVVYEAEELASGRRVALKVLAEELSVSEEAFERFRREARIAASVSDASCVFVFGAHQIDGAPAIAMELCAGETLEHRLGSGPPVPIETAVRWAIEILDGLEAAHQAGVLHRDVKPSNCFLSGDGRIKVGDFGLARSLERDIQLTRSGVFLGSPLYASPEQVRGRSVDLRSDLYSAGATLYALLAGRSPYVGENLGQVLARILSEPPEPPRALRPDIPRGLEKVVLRSMAREPAQRFQSHAEMRDALRPFTERTSAAASPLRRFCAYLLDSGAISLLQFPTMAIWTRFDPGAMRPRSEGSLGLESPWLTVTLGLLGFAYFAVSEGFFQRSIGKWITGQRVVAAGNALPGALPGVVRALTWIAPGLLAVIYGLMQEDESSWINVAIGTGLLPLAINFAMLSTMRRRNGWRGVHEFVSRTRVVAEPLPFARFVRHKAPPPTRLEPSDQVPKKLGEYSTVGRVGRAPSGEVFEASDSRLERRVWIQARVAGTAPLDVERRSMDRPARLRWLDGFDERGVRHEVFEAPGGASLPHCGESHAGLSWPTTHRVLSGLAAEIDREPAPRLSLDQLWIDRSWNLRILDEPIGERPAPPCDPIELLAQAACATLGVPPGSDVRLPPDLPEHAEGTARRLYGLDPPFRSLAEVRRALSDSADRPQGLTWRIRGLQMLLGSGLPIILCAFIVSSIALFVVPQAGEMSEAAAVLREIQAGHAMTAEELATERGTPSGPELDPDGVRARSILASQVLERPGPGGQGVSMQLSEEDKALIARVREEHAQVTPEEVAWARATVAAERPEGYDPENVRSVRMFRKAVFVMPFVFCLLWCILGVLLAFILRGGASMRLVSIAVREKSGRRAGRLRCTWRALLCALPFAAIYFLPVTLVMNERPAQAWLAFGAAMVVHAILIAVSLRSPARGWQDHLAGTRLVPR